LASPKTSCPIGKKKFKDKIEKKRDKLDIKTSQSNFLPNSSLKLNRMRVVLM
jgi:hypothetical protein